MDGAICTCYYYIRKGVGYNCVIQATCFTYKPVSAVNKHGMCSN